MNERALVRQAKRDYWHARSKLLAVGWSWEAVKKMGTVETYVALTQPPPEES